MFTQEEIAALIDAAFVTLNEGLGLPALESALEKLQVLEKESNS